MLFECLEDLWGRFGGFVRVFSEVDMNFWAFDRYEISQHGLVFDTVFGPENGSGKRDAGLRGFTFSCQFFGGKTVSKMGPRVRI